MGTCKSCRHWRPEDRSPTGMVCNKISGSASVAYPLLIINSTEEERAGPAAADGDIEAVQLHAVRASSDRAVMRANVGNRNKPD